MSLAKRLLLLVGSSVALIVLLSIVNHFQTAKVYEKANFNSVSVVPSILLLNEAIVDFGRVRVLVYRHVLAADSGFMKETRSKILEAREAMAKVLQDYDRLVVDAEDKKLLDEERAALADYNRGADHILELSQTNRKAEAQDLLGKYAEQAAKLNEHLVAHMKYNKDLGKRSASEGEATKTRADWIALIIGLAAVAILGTMGLTIVRSLVSRVGDANQLAERIAAGDLSRGVASTSTDEIGRLMASLEKMRQDLATTIREIAGAAENVAGSSAHLSTAAQQVAASTESQSQSTASAAAAVEELTVSIDHVGGSSDDASRRAGESEQMAIGGAREVESASTQIIDVARRVEETAQQIQALSEQVQKIGNVTVVIREVADQTNLLALNAAIEAARAGEQGRGFAVVADEVRKLAERTTLSVQEIAAMISAIQGEAVTAVGSMQSSRQVVGEVVASAERASASMRGIRSAAETVQSAITGISEALREQRAASVELSRNVEAIAQMSEENSSAVGSVSETASRLVAVSNQLKSCVSRFRF